MIAERSTGSRIRPSVPRHCECRLVTGRGPSPVSFRRVGARRTPIREFAPGNGEEIIEDVAMARLSGIESGRGGRLFQLQDGVPM